jgi:hypothetical protein
MKWYNTELEKRHADKLIKYLKEENVIFEPSQAGNLTHIEIYTDFDSVRKINLKIDDITRAIV